MMQPRVSAGHHMPTHTVINCIPYEAARPEILSRIGVREDVLGRGFPYGGVREAISAPIRPSLYW
jgi:hypothetical protein